jgi:hypothetical protein
MHFYNQSFLKDLTIPLLQQSALTQQEVLPVSVPEVQQ